MSVNKKYRIAIIGPTDTVSGFKALGVETFPARNASEALAQLRLIKQLSLAPDQTAVYAVVCVIEDVLADVDQHEYAKVVSGPLPAVIMLPGPAGSTGLAVARLRRLAEQAIGSAII